MAGSSSRGRRHRLRGRSPCGRPPRAGRSSPEGPSDFDDPVAAEGGVEVGGRRAARRQRRTRWPASAASEAIEMRHTRFTSPLPTYGSRPPAEVADEAEVRPGGHPRVAVGGGFAEHDQQAVGALHEPDAAAEVEADLLPAFFDDQQRPHAAVGGVDPTAGQQPHGRDVPRPEAHRVGHVQPPAEDDHAPLRVDDRRGRRFAGQPLERARSRRPGIPGRACRCGRTSRRRCPWRPSRRRRSSPSARGARSRFPSACRRRPASAASP